MLWSSRRSSRSRVARRSASSPRPSSRRPAGVFHPENLFPHWRAINLTKLEDDLTRAGILPDGYERLSEQMKFVLARLGVIRNQIDLGESWRKVEQVN